MTDQHRQTVLAAVVSAVDEVVGLDIGEDDLDSPLADTGIDSLDLIEVVMVVEEQLGISTTQEAFEDVATLRDAVTVFEQQMASA